MLALPLRLPTASYGGHMGHFLLSTLALMGSTPLGNSRPSSDQPQWLKLVRSIKWLGGSSSLSWGNGVERTRCGYSYVDRTRASPGKP